MKVSLNKNSLAQGPLVYNPTRRKFIQAAFALPVAATILPLLMPFTADAAGGTDDVPPHALKFTTRDGKDPGHKLVIVYMQGGLSNFDTFDPKTHDSIKGPFKQIDTASRNIKFTEVLEPLARHANDFLVINNLRTNFGEHTQAAAKLLTTSGQVVGSGFLAPTVYKNPFVEFSDLLTNEAAGQVGYVVLHQNTYDRHSYNRVWDTPWGGINHDDPVAVYAPYDTNTGTFTNPFSNSTNVSASRYRERSQLLEAFDNSGHVLVGASVNRHNRAYAQARSLLGGQFNQTFDLNREPLQIRERYGDSKVGKQFLLARRMLESGARVIVVNDGNYDFHWGIKEDSEIMLPPFSRALSAFIDDIKQRGNEKVYIAIITEFGRDPRVNTGGRETVDGNSVQQPPGRHHWANAFGMVIISNDHRSIGAGRTIGRTNNNGEPVGQAFDSSLTGETLLELLKIGRFEKRGEVVTGKRFPYIDIINERVVD